MHDVASRLTSLHDQLNHYVYLTDNLDELKKNVEQIQVSSIEAGSWGQEEKESL